MAVPERKHSPAYTSSSSNSPVMSHYRWWHLSWILPSHFDADNMAAQEVPYDSTMRVDKNGIEEIEMSCCCLPF